MKTFFTDEESPCGAVKSGQVEIKDDLKVQTWDCGCEQRHYWNGIKTLWCGWMAGKVFRMLPGVFEAFATQDETRIAGTRNGRKLYQR